MDRETARVPDVGHVIEEFEMVDEGLPGLLAALERAGYTFTVLEDVDRRGRLEAANYRASKEEATARLEATPRRRRSRA